MLRRKKQPGFSMSEPEFLISYMDRRQDWAVIICLVGGGQEIHTGEAGIGAWLDAVNLRLSRWRMFIHLIAIDRQRVRRWPRTGDRARASTNEVR